MNEERSLEEINAHRHGILPDPENYRIVAIRCEQDIETSSSSLALRIRNQNTGHTCWLHFPNPKYNCDPFYQFFDWTGLYLMTTSHLGWSKDQRIEVGDWDGDPPVFWAEDVELIEE